MTIQSRRRRRLAIVALVLLAMIGSMAALYALRQSQIQEALLAHRIEGMEAVEQRDNAAVLDHLGAYLRRHDQDVEALYEYARARRRIEAPRGKHLTEAIGVLQRVVGLAPEHAGALHELLDLYSLCGYNHEAIDVADTILRLSPQESNAWRVKAVALARMRQFKAAKEAAEKCLALSPFEMRAAILLMDVRQQLGATGAELVQAAQAHRRQHPQSTIADLQEAYAHRLAGNPAASTEMLRVASGGPALDDAYVVMLVMLLDDARLSAEAMAVLEKASQNDENDTIRTELVRRLWEANRYKDINSRLAALDPSRRDTSDVLLGLRAASLYELNLPEDAQVITAALRTRGADSIGAAWSMVLDAVYRGKQGKTRGIISACTDALGIDPTNAYFAHMQGSAWWILGETDLALASWKTAIKHRPAWPTPRICTIHALLAAGHNELAQREARLTVERSPQRVDVIAAWVVAHAATLTPDDLERAQQLLPAAAAVQRAAPYEPQTLPLYIALQAQCGKREVAADRLRQVLAKAPALDEATWLKLASVSRNYGLELEVACHEKIQKEYGITPGLALAQAQQLAARGKVDAGKTLLLNVAAASPARFTLAWRMAIGKYLDQVDDPTALNHWIALADEHADDSRVQSWALQTQCIQSDAPTHERLVERLRELSGPGAVTWRLARAQKLLAGEENSQSVAEAAALLQGVVAEAPTSLNARVMLARSLQRMKLEAKASSQILNAARVQPQSVELALEAARMLQSQREFSEARVHLLRVATRTDLDSGTTARVAAMLARQGEDAHAIRLLDELAKAGPLSEHQLLLLGALERRRGNKDRVAFIIAELLAVPTLAGIEFAADYHHSTGDAAQSQIILDQLNKLPISDVARFMLLGRHEQRFGEAEKALTFWKQAVKADSTRADTHRALIAQHLRMGQVPQSFAALEAARKSLPKDNLLQELSAQSSLIEWSAGKTAYQPLLIAMLQNESQQALLIEGLDAIKSLTASNHATVFPRLRTLCQANMDCLPLVIAIIQLHVVHGRAQEAAGIASTAMGAHPTSWEPAWIQSELLGVQGRWDESLVAAQEWRRRALTDTLLADMMIAEAFHRLGNPADAVKQLSIHFPRALTAPQQHGDLLWRLARSQIALGEMNAAAQSLAPIWKDSAAWRLRSIDLALQTGVTLSQATTWLDRMATIVSASAVAERGRLAATWLELSSRFKAAECRQRAEMILTEMVQQSDAHAEPWFLFGMLHEQKADLVKAERCYREALKLSPEMSGASNNLAMILARHDQHLEEALDLAARAVRSAPQSPACLDTLAYVQHRMQRHDDAIATARKAIELQPDNPHWRSRLAALQIQRVPVRTSIEILPVEEISPTLP